MSYFEYMVVPAPKDVPRKKGVRSTDARFAHGFEEILNEHAGEGWEFQRAETMSIEVSRGFLRGKSTEAVTMLIFRRWVEIETATRGPRPSSFDRDADGDHMEAVRPASANLRPVPEAEPPRGASANLAPGTSEASGQADRPRRVPPLGANRRADLPLRPVPGPERD